MSSANDSDYGELGSDEEELDILQQLVHQADRDIEDAPQLRLPKIPGLESHPLQDIHYDTEKSPQRRSSKSTTTTIPPVPENASPLERFRKPPRKGLSVTDLVSPSWCELQFYYSLVEPQRKKKTVAMKQGSAVHQALEDEVHLTVPVTITKKEDKWGLKFWNIIQGLRTLRETGRTRELEVWGMVEGEVVNGIIDELSYECPDPKYEPKSSDNKRPEDQTSIADYLTSDSHTPFDENKTERIYITDVKTRGTPTLPTGASIRPTLLQLHLYHHLLRNFALGNLSVHQLADRYGFDVNETFSDSFIAEIGMLNQEHSEAASSQGQPKSSTQSTTVHEPIDVILAHNNPASLWEFLMTEMRLTFLLPVKPSFKGANQPIEQETRLANLLTAEYLAPTYRHVAGTSKKSIGKKSFGFNAAYLQSYIDDNLTWWHGQREARGVKLEDAWKCRHCDFRDDCAWIHDKDAAALQEVLQKKALREAAGLQKKSASGSV